VLVLINKVISIEVYLDKHYSKEELGNAGFVEKSSYSNTYYLYDDGVFTLTYMIKYDNPMIYIGAITNDTHTKENIISKKVRRNRKPCSTCKVALKNTPVNIRLSTIPLSPRKVFASTFPSTMVVNFDGLQNRFSKVPA
jgi:hypothetical protein